MRRTFDRWRSWAVMAVMALWVTEAPARIVPEDTRKNRALADALFTNGTLLRLRLEIPEAGLASLRKDQRKYVEATLREGNLVYSNVAVHLKGSSGSFRGVDDKPGLTLNFGTFESGTKFHGLKKFHLNNSVQDPTYLSEWVCGELFHAAGVPTPRAALALLELNNRKLGLYVVLESVERDFLARYFKKTRGNVYGQPGGGDVSDPLERMGGDGPLDRADLKALARAAEEPDAARRWERLQQVLDVDRFLSFMALEVMLCHWDGYTFARHNFHVYHDQDTDKMVFIPHDLDQLIGDPNVPIVPGVNGLMAQTTLKTPEMRRRYQERFGTLFTNLFVVRTLTNRIHQRVAQVLPDLKAFNPNVAREFENNANGLKGRIVARAQGLEKQFNVPAPKTLKFENNLAKLTGWRKQNQGGGADLEQVKADENKPALWIRATGQTTASWRTRVSLPAGRYRFEAMARTAKVSAIRDANGEGAGLRISGRQRPNKLAGDSPWQKLTYEFEVGAGAEEVELVCELRATKGEVWFEVDSLRLARL